MDLVLENTTIRRRRQRGFSLVEAMLGLTILLLATIGLLPLFTQAIQQNTEGKQSTEATGHGRTELENLMQVDFNNWLVTVEEGNERELNLYWTEGDGSKAGDEYWTEDPTGALATWSMDSVVRQFSILGVRDDDLDGRFEIIEGLEDKTPRDGTPDDPLPAGTGPEFIHVKTLDVTLAKRSSAVTLGAPLKLELRSYKAF